MAGLACKAPSTDLLDRVVVTVELIADRCTTYRGLTSEIPADKAYSFSEGCRALGDVSRTCGIGGATKPGCRFAHPCAGFVFDLQMCNRHDLKSCVPHCLLRCGFANERTSARMRRDNQERLWEDARRDQSAL